jgi:anti-sigma factor RsiW
MTCTDVRAALPALLYGELPAVEADALHAHLAGCPACRAEHDALRRLGGALDAVTAPAVRVDLERLYQEAARLQARRLRCWRRAALACCGVAAVTLVVLALKLEVRVDAQQVVVRWGPPPVVVPMPAPAPAAIVPPAAVPAVSPEEVRLVKQLVHALAEDVADRDRQGQQALRALEERLDALQRTDQERWNATERYVSALYALNANLTRKE